MLSAAGTTVGAGRAGRRVILVIGILASLGAGPGCQSPATTEASVLSLVSSHAVGVIGPSGLTIDESGTVLWTVAKKNVIKLALDGTPTDTLSYSGDDLEGVAYDPSDRTLWVVEERTREVVHLDLDGNVLSTRTLPVGGDENSGLEGICLNAAGEIFALKEKDPAQFLAVGAALSVTQLDFAGDCSGLAYNMGRGLFWIVSDQERKLYLWGPQAGLVEGYSLPFDKAEGVAYDEAAKLIYIVSDVENRLYVYRIEGP